MCLIYWYYGNLELIWWERSVLLYYNQCYHGTTQDSKDLIIKEKKFTYKERKNHWLGYGAYFFLEDKDKAIWFINANTNPEVLNKPKCIITAKIQIEDKKILNLDTEAGRKNLSDFVKSLEKENLNIPNVKNDEKHCLIINLYVEYFKMQAVKYTFHDNKIAYDDLNVCNADYSEISNNNIQLNVIDQKIIDFDNLVVENLKRGRLS